MKKNLQPFFALTLCAALGGDPDALDIWYCMGGEQPLEFPALGLSWPIDQPYQWTTATTA